MAYLWLALAIVFEVVGTTCMKLSEGYTKLWPSIGMAIFYILSFSSLGISLKRLNVGTAYAIWSGMGTVLIVLIGILLFKEQLTWMKAVCLMLIIAGVIGLNLSGGSHA
ncbi:DMT family transporter [Paenibacillus segetis]|uniref:QacE family quaternary ammonium compound efflux SMR transporter n=1 Tax=Paenibacillus segetis TaxID=1325360 RepID=A0ABQ1YTP5_9BACL|nr:multidrug efflux SMR transporter [Paenibacillus segetis]GGH37299.1 QacE family quaternary ammonium compound efflux SMR transporter [Paenibacillus segetis]